jgi:class 3 adenylate cyclase
MIGSTKISSDLSPSQLSKYYGLFLNSIALIAKNFGAKIVKNAGDALILYFDYASDPNNKNIGKFKNVLDCGLTMGLASNALNAKMSAERLPPIKYRISAEYGQVSIARSKSSQTDDLFGPAMNICSKINALARPNGLVIGQNLFSIVSGLDDEYVFEHAYKEGDGGTEKGGRNESKSSSDRYYYYPAHHVDAKQKDQIRMINPFERKALY